MTEKQIYDVWEWCGLKWFWNHSQDCRCGAVDDDDSNRSWHYKVNGKWELASNFYHEKMNNTTRPEFLGFLFKYAVPKLSVVKLSKSAHHKEYVAVAVDYNTNKEGKCFAEDPAEALFGAVYKVIKKI